MELYQEVVMDFAAFPFAHYDFLCVDCLEEQVSELGNHEALLQHRDHVADTAKVNDTGVHVPRLVGRLMQPLLRLGQVLDHR